MNGIGPSECPRALDRVRGAQMAPVIGRKVKEREHFLFVFGQTGNGLLIFDAILPGEDGQRSFRIGARSGVLNVVQI